MSADGSTLAVGAEQDNPVGAVFVFQRTETQWAQMVKLGPSADETGLGFGCGVSLSADGNTLAVATQRGQNLREYGAYIFVRVASEWTLSAKLQTSYSGPGAVIGSIALSPDGNVVGLGSEDVFNDKGAVFTFARQSNTQWVETAVVRPANYAPGDMVFFGHSFEFSNDGSTLAVGGYLADNEEGGVFVYVWNGTGYIQQGPKLVVNTALENSRQGLSVAISGDGNTIISGGMTVDSLGTVATFARDTNGNWAPFGGDIFPNDISAGVRTEFGRMVAISADGRTITDSAPHARPVGGAYVFQLVADAWVQQGARLEGLPAVQPQQGFGLAISGNGGTIALGGPFDSTGGFQYSGATWIFPKNA